MNKIRPEGPHLPQPQSLTPQSRPGQPGSYYWFYMDLNQPAEYIFDLAKGSTYKADLIDPWEMTITPVPGTFEGKFTLKLSGKPYQAVRFEKVDSK